MRIEHVLQAEVAAVVEVVLAELLYQLEVVQTVSQRHSLFEADICTARGGVTHTHIPTQAHTQGRGDRKGQTGRQGKDKVEFILKKRIDEKKMTLFFPVVSVQHAVADLNLTKSLKQFMTHKFSNRLHSLLDESSGFLTPDVTVRTARACVGCLTRGNRSRTGNQTLQRFSLLYFVIIF